MCECECHEDEYEGDWQPVPGKPGWTYDANNGPWHDGVTERTGLPVAMWRELYNRELT